MFCFHHKISETLKINPNININKEINLLGINLKIN